MEQVIHTFNSNATTGYGVIIGIDYSRGFYSTQEHDCIDAPNCIPTGSFADNSIEGRGRVVFPDVVCRGL